MLSVYAKLYKEKDKEEKGKRFSHLFGVSFSLACKDTKRNAIFDLFSLLFFNFVVDNSRNKAMEMQFERCGRSGILLPRVSLGLWHNFGAEDDYDRARGIVLHAFERGIVHLDLANNYGPPPGSAEQTLGRILHQDLATHRDELLLSTKAGYEMWQGPYGNWGSRKSLMASLDQSLKRMGVDYVDIFYSHRYDPLTPMDETLQALVDIVRQGKALYIGISRWPLEATKYAIDYLRSRDVPPLIYQGRLNLLDRSPQEEGILDLCEREGLGFIAFSPLAQGLLTDRYLSGTVPEGSRMSREHFLKHDALTPELLERLRRWNAQAEQANHTLAQCALSWVLKQKAVTSVLVGASSAQQLDDSLQCLCAPALE